MFFRPSVIGSLALAFEFGLSPVHGALTDLSGYQVAAGEKSQGEGAIETPACNFDDNGKLKCTFKTQRNKAEAGVDPIYEDAPPPANSLLASKIALEACDTAKNSDDTAFKTTATPTSAGTANADTVTTPDLDIQGQVTAAQKNCDGVTSTSDQDETWTTTDADGNTVCHVKKYFCARSDLYVQDPNDSSYVGLTASLVDGTTTISYDQNGSFATSVATSAFVAGTATASDTREAQIKAYRCDETGVLTSAPIGIGSTLNVCIFSLDNDVSLTVQEFDILTSADTLITAPIDNSVANFVTELPNALTGLTSGSSGFGEMTGTHTVVPVRTLMIPKIYDEAGGSTIKVTGTVGITYTSGRKLKSFRSLQTEETGEFSVEVELEGREMPTIAAEGDDSAAGTYATLGALGFVAAGALMM